MTRVTPTQQDPRPKETRSPMTDDVFLDGTGVTPGTAKCKCGPDCEFPCWQRLGIAPACGSCGCPSLPGDDEEAT